MSGLVLKDLCVLKKAVRSYVVILLVYAVLTATGMLDTSFLSGFLALLITMMPISSFSYDDLARWDRYAAALPVGRRGIVQSKYVFTLLISAGALVLGLGVSGIAAALRWGDSSLPELIIVNIACIAAGLFLNAVILPFLFRYGAEKSRMILLAVFVVVFGGGMLLLKFVGSTTLAAVEQVFSAGGMAAAAVAGLLCLLVSYFISCHIYQKKEL
jgi:ABC-2 type transport system permease protein